MQHLSQKTGYDLQFVTGPDILTFQQQMQKGVFDFAFINPVHYTRYRESAGYDAFARQQDAKLVGIIVVKADSAVADLRDLDHQTMAFPGPTALAATALQMNHLVKNQIVVNPTYLSSMDAVYSAVARGLYMAGGGETRTFESLDPTVRKDLRILWRAEPLPPHPFSAHPRVPKSVVTDVQHAMVEMGTTPEGKQLLRAIRFTGIEAVTDQDYDDVRSLGLKLPDEPVN
jgi:phosphonate transport system substrate-binding protein